MTTTELQPVDLFVIGGGINGCGIARDAAGRGLTVMLAEKGDLAQATSSASTKLFHGGLRYLEFFEFRLVREALEERETLLKAMPHISWPMRFVLPYHADMRFESSTPTSRLLTLFMPWMKGRRPAWLIRLGLYLYDTLGGREILPGTRTLDLTKEVYGQPLKKKFRKAFEYSDCWVQDSRLVVLNARDAQARGATILTRTEVIRAKREGELWAVTLRDTAGTEAIHYARALVNAAGPWVDRLLDEQIGLTHSHSIRLVRGSHIVVPKLYDHDRCYFFQGEDGRIIFAIPYEQDFTLIGTTDQDHEGAPEAAACSQAEADYLRAFAATYFETSISADQIVWTYSGVRPLYNDSASSATAATRDYVLAVDQQGAPLLNVFGGKITTYRRLAESGMAKLSPFFNGLKPNWTAGVPLPGAGFAPEETTAETARLAADYPFLGQAWAERLFRHYGLEARAILRDAARIEDLGTNFGATLTQAEVDWLMDQEWARTVEDVVWRRTKLGLRLSETEKTALGAYMAARAK
ncbi:glycerol-3-phosphate dehydrogenase [Rhodobacter xanthinilyticus]|uniref:Glycerol-3-phosphate dehydrogenase n=1 Tax=Rhodobacter xanthinilyticus TaxID=1850250 RepID=A0A1D9M815_9RHOB|nr:glycerol-3-phosphate dehydrogenase [Rhodobacter xanthinilyticus]AOZ67995.1 glycerol-3-phosphate dehydrogenase [Rhodobacter xanthinilyticus]